MDASQLTFYLSSIETYNQTKDYRVKILQGDQLFIKMALDVISVNLSESSEPVQKLLSIKFAKDCIETFNDDFISQFQGKILPIMEKIAQFDMGNSDEQRGIFYFSNKPDDELRKISNSFFRMTLECLWVWSKWFPVDPDRKFMSLYRLVVQRLIFKNVSFVKIQYFNLQDVAKYLPEQSIPYQLLNESNIIIKNDYAQTKGKGNNLTFVWTRLQCDLQDGLSSNGSCPVFPLDRLRQAVRGEEMKKMKLILQERADSQQAKVYLNDNNNNIDTFETQRSQDGFQTIIQLQKEVVVLVKDNTDLRQQVLNRDNEITFLNQKLNLSSLNASSSKSLPQTPLSASFRYERKVLDNIIQCDTNRYLRNLNQ